MVVNAIMTRTQPQAAMADPTAGSVPRISNSTSAVLLEDGRHTTLSDLRGRPVVINFWATWCGPCRVEMPELMRAATEEPNIVMLAVNVQETREQVSPFANEFDMEVPVVIDPEGEIKTLYAVRGLPTTYFIDKFGEITALYAGTLTPALLEERLARIHRCRPARPRSSGRRGCGHGYAGSSPTPCRVRCSFPAQCPTTAH
jgi:thiol-disulfide isomerase/thioredoxin